MKPPDDTFRLKAGWLVDGTGGPALRGWYLTVRDGIIERLSTSPPESPCSHVIDFTCSTVLPLLMDTHVHLAFSGTLDPQARKSQLTADRDQARKRVMDHLEQTWRSGVSAIREAGDHNGYVHSILRDAMPSSSLPVAISLTNFGWHLAGRYGSMIGKAVNPGTALPDVVRPYLSTIDHIKIIQSGINSIDHFGWQSPPQFSEEVLSRLTAAAHGHRTRVMIHANGADAVRIALIAGCDSIEHGYFMGKENLQRMADNNVVWVPTMIPMSALTSLPHLTRLQKEIARRTLEHQMEMVNLGRQLGVTIALGTDAGSIGVDHGSAVCGELALLKAAGFTIEQAIACATAHNSELMGLWGMGKLMAGRTADFLVMRGEPDRLIDGILPNFLRCRNGKWYSNY